MKRTYAITALAAGVAAVASVAAFSYGHQGTGASGAPATATAMTQRAGWRPPHVPPSLRVPAGNHLVVSLRVLRGVQVYTCQAGAWTFTEPAANMGVTSDPTVLYTAGPEWVSTTDGSAVWGSPLKQVARQGTIPDLLVKAVKNRGTGLFGRIDYIQRLDTAGGLPPTGGCTDGAITATPYHATENFWAPDSH